MYHPCLILVINEQRQASPFFREGTESYIRRHKLIEVGTLGKHIAMPLEILRYHMQGNTFSLQKHQKKN